MFTGFVKICQSTSTNKIFQHTYFYVASKWSLNDPFSGKNGNSESKKNNSNEKDKHKEKHSIQSK